MTVAPAAAGTRHTDFMRRTVIPALAVLLLGLGGCASIEALLTPPTPTPASVSAPTATVTPTPTPTATAAPTPTPSSAQSVTCETALTDAEYDDLETDGFTLNPDVFVLDEVMRSVMDDGFGCFWNRGGGDVRVWYAQAGQDADDWAEQEEALLDEGWTRIDDPLDGVLQAPTDNDNDYFPALIHRDGTTYYASYSDFLGSVRALLP
jgi:hypothetical protein